MEEKTLIKEIMGNFWGLKKEPVWTGEQKKQNKD